MSSSPSSSSSSDAAPAFAVLDDVMCRVEIMLGSGTITVRECLRLGRHTILPLAQDAGATLQVVANGVLLALGEVVIVDDTTGIRVTEITPPPSSEASA